jgi:hypothetical protein
MGTYFSDREFSLVEGAENAFHSPIPTQVVSNGEFNPPPQSAQQKQVEARPVFPSRMHSSSGHASSSAPV